MVIRKLRSCWFRARQVAGHLLVRFVAFAMPRNPHKIVIGGWRGELYCDNSKYLLQYILAHTDYRVVWVGLPKVRGKLPTHWRLSFAEKGSWRATYHLLTAKFWYCCQMADRDFTAWPLMTDAWGMKVIDSWHGIMIKGTGRLSPCNRDYKESCEARTFWNWYHDVLWRRKKEWLTVPSARQGELLSQAEPESFCPERCLLFGTPRNDFLINSREDRQLIAGLKAKYGKLFGFDPNLKIVMYMPTWRKRANGVFSFYSLPKSASETWREMLTSEHAVLLEKHHYMTYRNQPLPASAGCSLVVMPDKESEVDAQELLLIADVLISDYSGAFVDYGLLKRPAIHFAYDFEDYRSTEGLVYDLHEVAIGPIVETSEALFAAVQRALRTGACAQAKGYAEVVANETGHACEQIVDFMKHGVRS